MVDASNDSGYIAENTLSGGRFNTSLADTPSAVTVYTAAFLEDLGIENMDELVNYSVNFELGEGEGSQNVNRLRNVLLSNREIRIRGVNATRGSNYFESIAPNDSYNTGRYDESRGPNGVLFGISNAGGIINTSTLQPSVARNSGEIQYTFGDNSKNRVTAELNHVLIKNKLAFALAGVYEDSGGWRNDTGTNKQRAYGAITFRPNNRISITAMGETGAELHKRTPPFGPYDRFLGWRELGENTIDLANPPTTDAEFDAIAVTPIDGSVIYVVDEGLAFENTGTFRSVSYYDTPNGRVYHSGNTMIDAPELFPYRLNVDGPDQVHDQNFDWFQIDADVKLADNLYLNISHITQDFSQDVGAGFAGAEPFLYADPNRTLFPGSSITDYAGELYLEATYEYQFRESEMEETRLALSYDFGRDDKFFGSHRVAIGASTRTQLDQQAQLSMGFMDDHPNGLWFAGDSFTIRKYVDINDPGNFHISSGGLLENRIDATSSINFDGTSYDIGWHVEGGASVSAAEQKYDTQLAVAQSFWFNRRLVTTFGYRADQVTNADFPATGGISPVFDFDNPESGEFKAISRSLGGVFHLTNKIALTANFASSVGLPQFNRRVQPAWSPDAVYGSELPPPPLSEGYDYGIRFNLLDSKLNISVIQYEAESSNGTRGPAIGNLMLQPIWRGMFSGNNARANSLYDILVVRNGIYTESQWDQFRAELSTTADTGISADASNGTELRIVGNPTANWRFTFNASKIGTEKNGSYLRLIDWWGLKQDESGVILPWISEINNNTYELLPGYKDSLIEGRIIDRYIDLVMEASAASGRTPSNIERATGGVNDRPMRAMYRAQDRLIQELSESDRGFGLREYRANFLANYDFKDGRLKGLSMGGGLRWQSANTIGEDAAGNLIEGKDIFNTDFMIRYRTRFNDKTTVTYQVNIYNIFDDTSLTPRLFTADGYNAFLPTGNLAYTRADYQSPREIRASIRFQF